MWFEFFHHLTMHFAIVLPLVLAALATWALRRRRPPQVWQALRLGSAIALFAVLAASATGIGSAGLSGGETALEHHRYLGILALCIALLAAIAVEAAHRVDSDRLRRFGLYCWWIAATATAATGHWGGLYTHPDLFSF